MHMKHSSHGARLGLIWLACVLLAACKSAPIVAPNPLPAGLLKAPVASNSIYQEAWQMTTASSDHANLAPAVFGDSAFIPNPNGEVMRVNEAGIIQWQVQLPSPITTAIAANESVVAVITENGAINVLAATDGALKWSQSLTSEMLGAPTLAQGLVMVRTIDGLIVAFDQERGTRQWLLARPIGALSIRSHHPALVFDGMVIFAGAQASLFAVNPKSGQLVWEQTIARPTGISEVERLVDIVSAPVVEPRQTETRNARVCASTFNGKTTCLLAHNGQIVWQADIASASGLAISEELVMVVDRESVLVGLSRIDGQERWRNDSLKGRALTMPILTPRGLMLADGLGFLLQFDPANGQLISALPTPGAVQEVAGLKINPRLITQPPVRFGDALLVQSKLGSVTAFR